MNIAGVPIWLCCALLASSTFSKILVDSQPLNFNATGNDLAELYQSVLGLYSAFPPLDSDPDTYTNPDLVPVQVVVGQAALAINAIRPGSSDFTITSRAVMYWKGDDCNQTEAQQYACETRLGEGKGLRFLVVDDSLGAPQVHLSLSQPNIHATPFIENGAEELIPDVELLEATTTYKKTFDVRQFPFEVHALDVSWTSLYSSNLVQISRLPDFDTGVSKPSVPPGWTYLGNKCTLGIKSSDSGRLITDISDGAEGLGFVSYQCTYFVSRTNPGWWMTSFLLFCGIVLTAYVGSVGVMSHGIAECRDDRDDARKALYDGTRLIGTFTIGLLLTYIFQVEISPYGQPVEFWPRIPTSTMIYSLGVIAIFMQSFAGLIGSFLFCRPLLAEGFVGGPLGPYNLEKCPKEGDPNIGESRGPLLLKKYDPNSTEVASSADGEEQAPKIQRTRQANTKRYNVLSVEEALIINVFVRRMFFLKTGLFVGIILCATIILSVARAQYGNLIDEVSAIV